MKNRFLKIEIYIQANTKVIQRRTQLCIAYTQDI